MASLRDQVVAVAKSQLGCPYDSMQQHPLGSSNPGFGCCMLVCYCLNKVLGTKYYGSCWHVYGEAIGAPTYNQGGKGEFELISASEAQPGDVVLYFKPNVNLGYSSSCSHAALYIGNGRVIGAYGYGTKGTSYYMKGGSVRETSVAYQSLGGAIRYARCKRLRNVKATTPATDANTTKTAKGDFKVSKTVTFKTKTNVRDQPSITKGKVVTHYEANQSVTIDAVSIAEGIVWGHYVGTSSGKDRYVSLTGTIK